MRREVPLVRRVTRDLASDWGGLAHSGLSCTASTGRSQVLAKEADLDQAFAGARIDDAALHRMVADLGLQGEFRYTHLKYHLAMRDVLSPDQIAAYDRLRGYDSAIPPISFVDRRSQHFKSQNRQLKRM